MTTGAKLFGAAALGIVSFGAFAQSPETYTLQDDKTKKSIAIRRLPESGRFPCDPRTETTVKFEMSSADMMEGDTLKGTGTLYRTANDIAVMKGAFFSISFDENADFEIEPDKKILGCVNTRQLEDATTTRRIKTPKGPQ